MSVQDERGFHDTNRDSWHEAQREKLQAMAVTDLLPPLVTADGALCDPTKERKFAEQILRERGIEGTVKRDKDRAPAVFISKPLPLGSVPAHYAGAVTPWDLQKSMKSSGNAFVDARRTDAIEYAFRLKDDLLGDLIKARHCMDEAITFLKAQKNK